jgi:hypothetical protein
VLFETISSWAYIETPSKAKEIWDPFFSIKDNLNWLYAEVYGRGRHTFGFLPFYLQQAKGIFTYATWLKAWADWKEKLLYAPDNGSHYARLKGLYTDKYQNLYLSASTDTSALKKRVNVEEIMVDLTLYGSFSESFKWTHAETDIDYINMGVVF